ncbi:MAG: hypothetical protein LBS53_06605 [Synergistaceae bacterium]|jgi:hypothetical protein|nr:hypothetical protein [Synergistaceae bacterium]
MMLFEITPKIFPARAETRIKISPLYEHVRFTKSVYNVEIIGMEAHDGSSVSVDARNGALSFTIFGAREQEYRIRIEDAAAFSVYCLDDDLFGRIPLKGDFHIHSNRSDGREPPAFVAAASRKIGMDFMAITDHHRYAPSLEAIDAFRDFKTDLLIFPGEEVHPPNNPVHIINFGGNRSVNGMFGERYEAEVGKIAETLAVPDGVDSVIYAGCEWCFEKIRQCGGISLLCHPYWITGDRYNVASAFLDYMMLRKPFTAFELLGGHEAESNNIQTAYYGEKRSEGLLVPVVGVSDAHSVMGGDYFGWTYTIVFVNGRSLEDIKEGVERGFSAAVESLPGENHRAYGKLRFVKYALFLLREYFPAHDARCAKEAEAMFEHIRTDEKQGGFTNA